MSTPPDQSPHAAIRFEPADYEVQGERVMGRQSAGLGYLRAAVAAADGATLQAYTPRRASAEAFNGVVQELAPGTGTSWIPAQRLDLLAANGSLYYPGPELAGPARLRLRAGVAAYSLTGITHTIASHGAMDSITQLLQGPLMPWDALICTSSAVLSSVTQMLAAEQEYLGWRFGGALKFDLPQLPVIPLGVHCDDFNTKEGAKAAGRSALGIADDEFCLLFMGRLSFHAKAHPHAMYAALQAAAQRSGRKLVLVECGWHANDAIRSAFAEGAALFCPEVRVLQANGMDPATRAHCWAGADAFISLSDNIQESFGLTPVEAMAAGLPVIVSDWDGYKDTVRDGEDGFRIPTWMPPAGLGDSFARSHEAASDSYDVYCGLTCQVISVDHQVLVERLCALAGDPALCARLGAAGRERARSVFDWSVVYRQYQQLWTALAELRHSAALDPRNTDFIKAAPRVAAGRQDPFATFANFPTHRLGPHTRAQAAAGATLQQYQQLAGNTMFSYAARLLPKDELVVALLSGAASPQSAAVLAEKTAAGLGEVLLALAVLAKMGLVRLTLE